MVYSFAIRGGEGKEEERLFQSFKLGVGEIILDWLDQWEKLLIRAKAASLQEQPRLLTKSMLAIRRDDKRKKRRLINYLNELADPLDLEFLEL